MSLHIIEKTILIKAPKETVWKVLTDDESFRDWAKEFSAGMHAQTDWQEGSKVIYSDSSKNGIVGIIDESRPPEYLRIKYIGFYKDGVEDFESDMAKMYAGSIEEYTIRDDEDGLTELVIFAPMGEDYYEEMSAAWDRALTRIQELAEIKSV